MNKKVYLFIGVAAICIVVLLSHPSRNGAKILVVGDMMFDRYIRQVSYQKDGDHVFSCIAGFLKSYDLIVGNLEGPITENASMSLISEPEGTGNYTFTFPTGTAELLAKNSIKLVSLGNNHINNFGEAGISSTKKFLAEAGVEYFGLPANRESLVQEEEINNQKISFINYNEFGSIKVGDVIEKIKEEKSKGQIIIIYAHWGDEYVPAPQRIRNIAKNFAEAGADIIIGSHPHVVSFHESFGSAQDKKTTAYYSLGNFIFDQYWDDEVSTGLTLELNIKNGQINIMEHEVSLNSDGRTCLKK